MTNDTPASVFVNGQYVEKTPYIGKDLKPGEYTVRIQPDDTTLVPYETNVTLNPGLLTVMTWKPGNRPETSGGVIYELEKLSNNDQSELSVVSLPDTAIVSIDNGSKEFTPLLTTELAAGHHQLDISLPSYDAQSHTINLIEGHRLNVTIKLARTSDALEQPPTQPTASGSAQLDSARSATAAAQQNTDTATNSAQTTVTQIKVKPTNFFRSGREVLRVRAAASQTAEEVGVVEVGETYQVQDVSESGWYQIAFDDKTGWISGQYAQATN